MKITPRFYKVYPELALFVDDAERTAILRTCQRRLLRMGRFWAMALLVGLLQGVVIIFMQHLVIPLIPTRLPPPIVAGLLSGLLGGSFMVLAQFAWRKPIQKMLRTDLVSRGVPVCLHCGYDLRGQTEPRCPECGSSFDPTLMRTPPVRS